MRVRAPAKINLWLDVLGRRDDGFHEIDTGMLAVDLCDRLEISRSATPGVTLELAGGALAGDVPAGSDNLAARAARGLLAAEIAAGGVPPDAGLHVRLEKRVPSGAGLGGGSSDAAATVVGGAAALGIALDAGPARALLAGLGSDCVFFLDAAATGFARCQGRGERVEPLSLDEAAWHVALLVPAVSCATAEVYRAWRRSLSGAPRSPSVRENPLSRPEDEARAGIGNRLEAAALAAVPALAPWRDLLDTNGAQHFVLSGSGSAFFGLHRDGAEARESLHRLVRLAAERGLRTRGHWVVRPLGRGVVAEG